MSEQTALESTMPKVDIFKGLEKHQIDELLTWFDKQIYPPKHFIFEEGAQADGLYVLCRGSVGIVKASGQGKFRLAKLDSPNFFGEMAFLNDVPRSAAVRAQTEVLCGFLAKDVFQQKLEEHNLVAMLITINLARVLSLRLLKADKDLANLAARLAERQKRTTTNIPKIT